MADIKEKELTVEPVEKEKEDKSEVATKEHTNMVADFSGGGIFNSSDSFKLAYQMAKAMAQSTIVPLVFQKNEPNCMLAIAQAQRLGTDPFVIANNMFPIQGKVTWKSEFVIAMINASKKFDMELQFEEEEKDGKPYSCTCYTFKDGRKITGIKVTMDMANAEGWTTKNGTKWKNMPQLMLRYRAATFFGRFNAPEITSGLYTVEEGEDVTFSNSSPKKQGASLNDVIVESEVVS